MRLSYEKEQITMTKLNLPLGPRRGQSASGQSVRKTAQISNAMMEAVELRATEEALPVATFVRRAVSSYVSLAERGALPEVNLEGLQDGGRGTRGPSAQWTRSISYVLSPELSESVSRLAESAQEGITDTVRRAVGLALVRESRPVKPMRVLSHGFVTKPVAASKSTDRTVVDVLKEIRIHA
jgi:hypothetical protein